MKIYLWNEEQMAHHYVIFFQGNAFLLLIKIVRY